MSFSRRNFLRMAGALASSALVRPMATERVAFGQANSSAEAEGAVDYTLRIGVSAVEIAPGHVIKTIGYNGHVPGPVLRFREDTPVKIDVYNDTAVDELVHWHGQLVSSEVDGASEEGTPVVAAYGHRRYSFAVKPAGTRFYHTHNRAFDIPTGDLQRRIWVLLHRAKGRTRAL
jgi:FtsP/CotA-like multicopper oxidase with cupredoxin domain